jgi:hypothetical protein
MRRERGQLGSMSSVSTPFRGSALSREKGAAAHLLGSNDQIPELQCCLLMDGCLLNGRQADNHMPLMV